MRDYTVTRDKIENLLHSNEEIFKTNSHQQLPYDACTDRLKNKLHKLQIHTYGELYDFFAEKNGLDHGGFSRGYYMRLLKFLKQIIANRDEPVDLYSDLQLCFSDHLILFKDKEYYIGREASAEKLISLLGNRVRKIGEEGNLAVGSPNLSKIETVLVENKISYIVASGEYAKKVTLKGNNYSEIYFDLNEFFNRNEDKKPKKIIDIEERLGLVRYLADGIDPFSGEIFGPSDLLSDYRIKLLLEDLANYYTRRIERENSLPERNGEKWSIDEDEQLQSEIKEGIDVKEIARIHKRTHGAIMSRIEKVLKYRNTDEAISEINEEIELEVDQEENAIDYDFHLYFPPLSDVPSDRCENCMNYRRELCGGNARTCEDFERVPYISDDEKDFWPKEMDATRFKREQQERKDRFYRSLQI